MCGIVGMFSSTTNGLGEARLGRFMYEAMVTGWLRGEESTGMFSAHKETGNVFYHKSVLRGAEFMDTPAPRRMLDNRSDSSLIVGHHRWCTKGTVTYDNAHPFQYGHITLVHNGSLQNDFYFPHTDTGIPFVDSAKLAYNLSKTDNVTEFLSKVRGAYALVWWDQTLKAMRIVRNDDRPLHFAWGKGYTKFFFSSEPRHLFWMLDRNAIEIEEKQAGIAFEPLNLHTFKVEEGKITVSHEVYKESDEPYRSAHYYKARPTQSWTESNRDILDDEYRPTNLPMLPQPQADRGTGSSAVVRRSSSSIFPIFEENKVPILTKGRQNKLNALLAPFGTEFGRIHMASPQLFEHSAHGAPGVHGIGYFSNVGSENLDFIVPSISSAQFGALEDNGKFCHLRVIGLSKSKKHKKEQPFLISQVAWAPTLIHWENTLSKQIVQASMPRPEDLILGPQNIMIMETEYIRLTKDGCAVCSDPITIQEAPDLHWVKDQRPVCQTCYHSSDFWATEYNISRSNLL